MGRGNPVEIWDYLDLALLRLAKLGRKSLSAVAEAATFYEEFFTDNDVAVMTSGGDIRRYYRGMVLRQVAWANMPKGARVLDVGCGIGDNLRYVLREDASFFGLEYALKTACAASRLLGDRVAISAGSATAIPYESDRFDLVLCIEVLEHVDKDEVAISEIARVLRPGGALILSLPYRHWFPYYFTAMGHLRHYTRSDVARLLDRAGLSLEYYLPNFPKWSRFANYAYITCRIYALMFRLFGKRPSPVEVRLPFGKRRLMEVLFSALEPLRQGEAALDYSTLETSTFILARKRYERSSRCAN